MFTFSIQQYPDNLVTLQAVTNETPILINNSHSGNNVNGLREKVKKQLKMRPQNQRK